MKKKIELFLQIAADFQAFCAPSTSSNAALFPSEELLESDLDMVAAAAKSPTYTNAHLSDNN